MFATKFQSRNREAFNFYFVGSDAVFSLVPRFNLVIERLLISTTTLSDETVLFYYVSIS